MALWGLGASRRVIRVRGHKEERRRGPRRSRQAQKTPRLKLVSERRALPELDRWLYPIWEVNRYNRLAQFVPANAQVKELLPGKSPLAQSEAVFAIRATTVSSRKIQSSTIPPDGLAKSLERGATRSTRVVEPSTATYSPPASTKAARSLGKAAEAGACCEASDMDDGQPSLAGGATSEQACRTRPVTSSHRRAAVLP